MKTRQLTWFGLAAGVLAALGLFVFAVGVVGAADPANDVQNELLARRLFDATDMKAVDEVVAEDVVLREPGETEPRHGREAYRQEEEGFFTAFPDLRFTIDELISSADKVVVAWTAHGTNTGELMGMKPTGKAITVAGISILTFENGKLVEEREQYDSAGLMQQLGQIPDEHPEESGTS